MVTTPRAARASVGKTSLSTPESSESTCPAPSTMRRLVATCAHPWRLSAGSGRVSAVHRVRRAYIFYKILVQRVYGHGCRNSPPPWPAAAECADDTWHRAQPSPAQLPAPRTSPMTSLAHACPRTAAYPHQAPSEMLDNEHTSLGQDVPCSGCQRHPCG